MILIVFQFRMLCSLFSGGKHMSSSLKNFLPMFVPTFLQYGELNHVIFFCFFRFSAAFFVVGVVFIWLVFQFVFVSAFF